MLESFGKFLLIVYTTFLNPKTMILRVYCIILRLIFCQLFFTGRPLTFHFMVTQHTTQLDSFYVFFCETERRLDIPIFWLPTFYGGKPIDNKYYKQLLMDSVVPKKYTLNM